MTEDERIAGRLGRQQRKILWSIYVEKQRRHRRTVEWSPRKLVWPAKKLWTRSRAASVSRSLRRLEELGLVERKNVVRADEQGEPTSDRCGRITLTRLGETVALSLYPSVNRLTSGVA